MKTKKTKIDLFGNLNNVIWFLAGMVTMIIAIVIKSFIETL